jgi:hypothetical protein
MSTVYEKIVGVVKKTGETRTLEEVICSHLED